MDHVVPVPAFPGTLSTVPMEMRIGYVSTTPTFTRMLNAGKKEGRQDEEGVGTPVSQYVRTSTFAKHVSSRVCAFVQLILFW